MREKIATDLTAQYVYGDAEIVTESVSGFKYSFLEKDRVEMEQWAARLLSDFFPVKLSLHQNEI